MTVAQLKKIRQLLGFTQRELAMALGYMGSIAINRKENGASPITAQDEMILQLKFPEQYRQAITTVTPSSKK